MRQEHRAGEKVFIDYSDGLAIVDPVTGELIPTQLFVAVWGASNYTYAEMPEHYGCAVLLARPRKPRDKAPDGKVAKGAIRESGSAQCPTFTPESL